jgi:hypothetical protein
MASHRQGYLDASTKRTLLQCLEHAEDMKYYPVIVGRIRSRINRNRLPLLIQEETFSLLLHISREGNKLSVEIAESALNKLFKAKWAIYGGRRD